MTSLAVAACSDGDDKNSPNEEQPTTTIDGASVRATIADGVRSSWTVADTIVLVGTDSRCPATTQEQGITAEFFAEGEMNFYAACGGIDFWGNCWEWTMTTDDNGLYVIKGGSWDLGRDDCRSEKSDVVRDGSMGYENVGFRVVRTDI